MDYTQKMNRLNEYDCFFQEFLDRETLNQIQYISLRKSNYGQWEILVGVTTKNVDIEDEILQYAPRILKNICEYQLDSENIWEPKKQPKKMKVFEYSPKKKRERKKREKQWQLNPLSFFTETDLPNQIISYSENKVAYNGYVFKIDKDCGFFKSVHLNILMGEYDFTVKDRYGKEWKYLKTKNNKYYKYLHNISIGIIKGFKIGTAGIDLNNNDCRETTKQTYEKWKEKGTFKTLSKKNTTQEI